MTRFLVGRTSGMLGVLFVVCLFTFVVFFVLSPDPAVQVCGKNCTPERIDQIRLNLGLDRPFLEQFTTFLTGLFVGRTYGVGEEIGRASGRGRGGGGAGARGVEGRRDGRRGAEVG